VAGSAAGTSAGRSAYLVVNESPTILIVDDTLTNVEVVPSVEGLTNAVMYGCYGDPRKGESFDGRVNCDRRAGIFASSGRRIEILRSFTIRPGQR
jgi:hypothetical protein